MKKFIKEICEASVVSLLTVSGMVVLAIVIVELSRLIW